MSMSYLAQCPSRSDVTDTAMNSDLRRLYRIPRRLWGRSDRKEIEVCTTYTDRPATASDSHSGLQHCAPAGSCAGLIDRRTR